MLKKNIAKLLVFAMLLSMLPFTVAAGTGDTDGRVVIAPLNRNLWTAGNPSESQIYSSVPALAVEEGTESIAVSGSNKDFTVVNLSVEGLKKHPKTGTEMNTEDAETCYWIGISLIVPEGNSYTHYKCVCSKNTANLESLGDQYQALDEAVDVVDTTKKGAAIYIDADKTKDNAEAPRYIAVQWYTSGSGGNQTDIEYYKVNLTDVHTDQQVKISYNLNGGSDSLDDVWLTKQNDKATLATLPTPEDDSFSYAGHTFVGWSDSEELTTTVTDGAEFETDSTLYAIWAQNISAATITVPALVVGEDFPAAATVTETGIEASPAIAWKKANDSDVGEKVESGETYKAEITLTASAGYTFTETTTYTVNSATEGVTHTLGAKNETVTLTKEFTASNVEQTCATTFVVKGEGNALVSGASITVGSNEGTTDEQGEATFNLTKGTNYSYTVSADTYVTKTDSVMIGSNTEQTVTITLEKTQGPGNVTRVTVEPGELALTPGQTGKLTATVEPENATNKTVTWSSSNDEVATVEDGKVTAVAAGKATITAKAGDITATCAVTVTAVVQDTPATKYTVTVKTEPAEGCGTATANVTEAAEGAEVVVTITPNEGYIVTSITYNEEKQNIPDEGEAYTFIMPAGPVEVVVTFAEVVIDTAIEETATLPVVIPTDAEIKPGDKEDVKNAAEASTMDASDAADALFREIATAGTPEAEEWVKTAKSADTLEKLGLDPNNEADLEKVEIVVQPVLSIKPKAYTGADNGKPVLTLEIDGSLQILARNKDDKNGKPVELDTKPIAQSVEIIVALPFIVQNPPFAGHKGKWQYPTTAKEGKYAFTNPHGFSEFVISTEDGTVATNDKVTGYTYLTLAAAAEEAKAGNTLTIKKNNDESVELEAGVKVKLDKDVTFNGKINGNSVTFDANGEYTVTSASSGNGPSTGGGGGGGGSSKPSIKPGETATPNAPTAPSGGVAGFNDVAIGSWYAEYVQYVVDKGLFDGVGDGNFAPNANMTRAMMWTVLARYMGVDTKTTNGNWYEAAQAWAIAQGISDGTMATSNVTREQFVTMLWRLSGEPAATSSASFTDNGSVSAYAKTAVDWAVAQGIVNGYSDGSFKPQGSATRAEVAKMLTVFCTNAENAPAETTPTETAPEEATPEETAPVGTTVPDEEK